MSFSIRPSVLQVATSSEPVHAQPRTDSDQSAAKGQAEGAGHSSGTGVHIGDGVVAAVSPKLTLSHINDLLSNPILHPLPNLGPIPRG